MQQIAIVFCSKLKGPSEHPKKNRIKKMHTCVEMIENKYDKIYVRLKYRTIDRHNEKKIKNWRKREEVRTEMRR